MIYKKNSSNRSWKAEFGGIANLLINIVFVFIALIVCVGATNICNFMDGINGITAGYSAAVLIPLLLMNRDTGFISEPLLAVALALLALAYVLFKKKYYHFHKEYLATLKNKNL